MKKAGLMTQHANINPFSKDSESARAVNVQIGSRTKLYRSEKEV